MWTLNLPTTLFANKSCEKMGLWLTVFPEDLKSQAFILQQESSASSSVVSSETPKVPVFGILTHHRPRPGSQCSFVPWRWHVSANRIQEFETLFYHILRAGQKGPWKQGWSCKKSRHVVHRSRKHLRSFMLEKTVWLLTKDQRLKRQLRCFFEVKILPLPTRLIPGFSDILCVDISVIKPWLKTIPVTWYNIISLHGLNCPIKFTVIICLKQSGCTLYFSWSLASNFGGKNFFAVLSTLSCSSTWWLDFFKACNM